MASITPRSVALKGARAGSVLIRAAVPDDAPALLALTRHIVDDVPDLGVTDPDEVDADEARRRERLQDFLDDPSKLFLVAEHAPAAGGPRQIVGDLSFTPNHKKRRMAHVGSFGIAIARDWRGKGIGRALIKTLLAWAADHPVIEKVTLGVFATNERAIALYRSLGFVEEGHRPREFKIGPDRYVDDVRMYRFVKPGAG
jgi:RimJ/RimL family protein N-acetyltransferase